LGIKRELGEKGLVEVNRFYMRDIALRLQDSIFHDLLLDMWGKWTAKDFTGRLRDNNGVMVILIFEPG